MKKYLPFTTYRYCFFKNILALLFVLFSLQITQANTGDFGGKINMSSTPSTILLNWTGGVDSSGRTLDYTVEYRDVYLSTSSFLIVPNVSVSGGQVNVTISQLNPNSSYNIRITPKDSAGVIRQAQLIIATTLSNTSGTQVTLSGVRQTESIVLAWVGTSISNQSFVGFNVEYRVSGAGSTFLPYNSSVINSNQTTITNLENGKVYDIRVAALDKAGNQITVSNTLTLPFGLLPSTPQKPTARLIDSTSIDLYWNEHPIQVLFGNKVNNYFVEYKKLSDSGWRSVTVPSTGTYTSTSFTSLAEMTQYQFRVSAVGDAGMSSPSLVESITTGKKSSPQGASGGTSNSGINTNTSANTNTTTANTNSASGGTSTISSSGSGGTTSSTTLAPGIPGVVNMVGDTNAVRISWVDGLPGGSPITSYVVDYKPQASITWQTKEFSTSSAKGEILLNNLQENSTYDIRLAAQNRLGTGVYSKTFTIKTGTNLKACEPILTSYIKLNSKTNDPENVRRLQLFLRDDLGYNARVTGIYGKLTFDLVKRFQLEYKEDVLAPWKLTKPTGWVYITTKKKVNDLYCQLRR